MENKLQRINDLMINEVGLEDFYIVEEILNGEKNLGEYKDFKSKVKVKYKVKSIYNAIADYMSSLVLMGAVGRSTTFKVHVNYVKGILEYNEEGREKFQDEIIKNVYQMYK